MNTPASKRHITRRKYLTMLLWGIPAFSSIPSSFGESSEPIQKIIRQSLDKLASRQNDDGSFGASTELFGRDPAVSALSGLAFLASGSLPARGSYGENLTKITTYLLSCSHQINERQDGFSNMDSSYNQAAKEYAIDNNLDLRQLEGLIANLRVKGQKPLYGHSYATLFLAEILGTINNESIRLRTKQAIVLIVRTQNAEGGWRYTPSPAALADISVTVCQISALRACQNAGLYVPKDTITRATDYIRSLQNLDGGFRYMTPDGPSGYGRTAAAIHALQSGDDAFNYHDEIQRGFDYLESVYSKDSSLNESDEKIEYWTYAQFYAALAYWRAAVTDTARVKCKNFAQQVCQDLLDRQSEDGLWSSSVSTEVETAFALCTLLTFQENAPFFLR